VTPKGFVEDLKALELGGVGSDSLPNGLRDPREARSYQEYYDEKFFTRDAPRRPRPPLQPLAPPQGSRRPPHSPAMLSPTPSGGSAVSHSSAKDDKEKKKKWYKF
jgi:syntaxin-binding protein 1